MGSSELFAVDGVCVAGLAEGTYGRFDLVSVCFGVQIWDQVDGSVVGDDDQQRVWNLLLVADGRVEPGAPGPVALAGGGAVEDHTEGVAAAVRAEENGAIDQSEPGDVLRVEAFRSVIRVPPGRCCRMCVR